MNLLAKLRNKNHPEWVSALVSFDDPYREYEGNLEVLANIGCGSVKEQDCLVERIERSVRALVRLEGTAVNYDELDYLVRRLDGFDSNELVKFDAAAHLMDLHDVRDMINLTFCCQEATVITDFSKLRDAGINHYLTVNGGAPTEEVETLDGEQIARDLIAGGQGKVTPFGVIYENGMRLEPCYSGKNFPGYLDHDEMVEIDLVAVGDTEGEPLVLYLPMTETRLDRTLERAGIGPDTEIKCEGIFSNLPDPIHQRTDYHLDGITEVNGLCLAMKAMGRENWRKLEAVAAFADAFSATELRHLAENMDQFDFVPNVKTAEEYGRYMIQESSRFAYDPELEDFYDYGKYGEERIAREEGHFVEQGYVSYHGIMSLDELMRDDPAELEQQMGGMNL